MINFELMAVPAIVGAGYRVAMVSAFGIVVLAKADGSDFTKEEAEAFIRDVSVDAALPYYGEEPEPGPDWPCDEPAWGQEDTSPETAEKRKQDWDRWYDGQDLPE